MKKILGYIIVTIVLALTVFYISIEYFRAEEGAQAPDFEAQLIDGTELKLSQLKGKHVLLDFWGSWCAPCRQENKELARLHNKYKDDLTIVTVALEKDSLMWKKIAEQDGFAWKHQIVSYNKYVMLSPIARKYGVTKIPAKFLIAPDGTLLGQLSFQQIDSLLISLKK